MNDKTRNLQSLKEQVKIFCEKRNWDQFHSGKELAIGAVTEASELLEHFRFLTDEQVEESLSNQEKRKAIGEELADVLFFLLRFSQKYDFDLNQCFQNKMEKNNLKYPADQFHGKNHKSKIVVKS